jgi:hypothetical protein
VKGTFLTSSRLKLALYCINSHVYTKFVFLVLIFVGSSITSSMCSQLGQIPHGYSLEIRINILPKCGFLLRTTTLQTEPPYSNAYMCC